jgi:hypothetical protein
MRYAIFSLLAAFLGFSVAAFGSAHSAGASTAHHNNVECHAGWRADTSFEPVGTTDVQVKAAVAFESKVDDGPVMCVFTQRP